MDNISLYKLIEPQSVAILGCWEGNTNQYDEVFGYSVVGHFFLRSSETNEYSVLHPFKQAIKQYGEFKDITEFEKSILKDKDFINYVIEPEHIREVFNHVGPLGEEEVYIPCPYPMVGGLCEPNTYEKGNVWTFIELVGMTHGI